MSTATAQPSGLSLTQGRNYFLLRRLHSLTGVLFGGYICLHLLINATLVEGVRYDGEATVFQQQVDKIHGLPFLGIIALTLILLPIIYHTIYGIYITLHGQPNVANYPYAKNWFYFLQRVSAVILVLFIAFHYLGFKGAFGGDLGAKLTFVPVEHATQSTVNHFHAAWWVGYVIYPIGVLAATFHLANGFWAAGVTWGLTTTRKSQQRWGYLCVGLFVFTTICGFTAMISALSAEAKPLPQQYKMENRVGEKAPDGPTSLAPSVLPQVREAA